MRRTGTRIAVALALAAGLGLGAWAAAEEAVGAKEVGIRGTVARGDAEGRHVIKVPFGKKVIAYEVTPDSPQAAAFPLLIDKTVEATGVMSKGTRGENTFRVTSVKEAR